MDDGSDIRRLLIDFFREYEEQEKREYAICLKKFILDRGAEIGFNRSLDRTAFDHVYAASNKNTGRDENFVIIVDHDIDFNNEAVDSFVEQEAQKVFQKIRLGQFRWESAEKERGRKND